MAIIVEEKAESRSGDGVNQLDMVYVVRGTDDDSAARTALATEAPAQIGLLKRDPPSIEWVGPELWEGKVRYQKPESQGVERNAGESAFSFDTTGGTQHITQSLETVGSYGTGAPDFQGAIGVTHDSVEGVDITQPAFAFTVTRYIKADEVPAGYFGLLYYLTGRTNDATWSIDVDGVALTLQQGECLFQGASGSKRASDEWEITFRFAASPNATNLTIGSITGINKRGWEYLWVRYADEEDTASSAVVKKPVAVYVERVYEEGDFSVLGI